MSPAYVPGRRGLKRTRHVHGPPGVSRIANPGTLTLRSPQVNSAHARTYGSVRIEFVDGGIVDPLPTDVLQEMGVNKIIAVNAMPSSDRIRLSLQAQRELGGRTPRLTRNIGLVIRRDKPLHRGLRETIAALHRSSARFGRTRRPPLTSG